jgi:predicted RND superfamily exporter protein
LLGKMVARPRFVLALMFSVVIAALGPVGDLEFDSDINRVFVSGSALSDAQQDFENRFDQRQSDVVFLIESDDGLSPDQIVAARDLALDLEFAASVEGVASPFAVRFPPWHPDFPEAPIVPNDFTLSDLQARLDMFRDTRTGLPTFLARDALLIVASVDTQDRDFGETLREFVEMTAPLRAQDLRVTLTGPDVVGRVVADGLVDDLLRINLVGAGAVSALALILLAGWRPAVVAVVPALSAAAATLGLAAWLGYPITVLNNVIPMLMLVIGVANGLHLTVHFLRTLGETTARVTDTLRIVGPACVLTMITTALAFAAILVTPNRQVFEFAILGAAGVVLTIGLVLLGFSALGVLLHPAPRDIGRGFSGLSERLGRPAIAHPRLVSVIAGLALLLGGSGFATTTPWFPMHQNAPAGSGLSVANDRIAADFGGVYRMWIEMPNGGVWDDLRQTVRAVEEAAGRDAVVLSEVAIARWLGDAARAPAGDAIRQIPSGLQDRLRDPQDGTRRIAVNLAEPMRSEAALRVYDRIEAAARQAGAARVIGGAAIMRREAPALITQLSIGLSIAVASGAAVVAVAFRSIRLLLPILFANALPILAVGAALHVIDAGFLTPTSVLALTIAFGIAIDDTIHYLIRVRHAQRQGNTMIVANKTALRTAGGIMAMTTLLLCAGLFATVFSAFHPVTLFGVLMALALFVAWLTDIVLLPALLCLKGSDDET